MDRRVMGDYRGVELVWGRGEILLQTGVIQAEAILRMLFPKFNLENTL
jgi:hypothetical protein